MSAVLKALALQVADWVAKGYPDEAARLIEVSATSATVSALLDAQMEEIKRLRTDNARLEGLLAGREVSPVAEGGQ